MLDPLLALFRRYARGSPLRVLGMLALTFPLTSAVMNTPVVMMMVVAVAALAVS